MISTASASLVEAFPRPLLRQNRLRLGLILLSLLIAVLFSPKLLAAGGDLTLFTSNTTENGQEFNVKIQILILMTLLGLLPIMVLMMTCFTRFIIVLAILRQALGLQQSPPNKILTGIALALTLLVMRPVWDQVYTTALEPFQNDEITLNQALSNASSPLKQFMLAQTSTKAIEQIMDIAKATGEAKDQDLTIIIPAFVLSELKTAFQIGFMIYIPFLVIDMIVASVLMAMGMMMLSPLIVSLPFKLMLFVLCDGWALTVGTLTSSIQGM
ncbi:flagellar type III secretion system pore protein FliP [Budvicia aquatica]|uniref:Flagellar biosynthetic protein FliP n=1 Tax=Budvicia aquatica TaxID=82979 RepID=A0A2C6DL60_9GAMM|nr:flagellar type III secretion system pore protein FliP [Budvicia sp.]PHI29561.1 flagellar biosynthetic protein FliP [Budvicia aquatica]VFS47880.1 Flagellar biosynthetic protein fliP precursor [Budvicia aquatica]